MLVGLRSLWAHPTAFQFRLLGLGFRVRGLRFANLGCILQELKVEGFRALRGAFMVRVLGHVRELRPPLVLQDRQGADPSTKCRRTIAGEAHPEGSICP